MHQWIDQRWNREERNFALVVQQVCVRKIRGFIENSIMNKLDEAVNKSKCITICVSEIK